MGRRIAAFDFDGTLTRRDTFLPFLIRVYGQARVARAFSQAAPLARRTRGGAAHPRDLVKARVLQTLCRGEDPTLLAEHGEAYAKTLTPRLRPAMIGQLEWHLDAGHEVVIVSASLASYLAPFAAARGVDHVIAVELETGADGRLTGALLGPNVRGEEKAIRLRAWLDGDEPDDLWAYGNSSGDQELLAMATHPVWVGNGRGASR